MAWVEERNQGGTTVWRVVWRQKGMTPQRQQERFMDPAAAADFCAQVTAARNRWPYGWVPGVGYGEAVSTAPTFRDYAALTIAARRRADPRTQDDYLAMLTRHVHPLIGDIPVDQVTRFHVARIADVMHADGKSPKTIGNVHGLLSSVLSDAVADELIRRNPAVGAMPNLPDVRTEEMEFLSPADVNLICEHLDDAGRTLVRFLVGTGLRWSEATALQVRDVDLLDRKTLEVRRAWKRRGGVFELGSPKTNRSRRTLTLGDQLIELLIPLVAAKQPAEHVFTTPEGRPLRHSNFYNRAWRPAVARAQRCKAHADAEAPCGCPGTLASRPRLHDLRHTHASWLLNDKVTLPAVQRRLGHESITTTIDRYGHLAPEHTDEINASVDKALARR